ncbi:MAG: SpoIIE family protein phosphatase [Pseudomonadota bacterium]
MSANAEIADEPPQEQSSTAEFDKALRKRRVLVVDDSTAQRKMLSLLLRKWEFETSEAADGADALAMAEAEHFDIIISDWVMPKMSGVEFCKAIRAKEAETYTYFILLTSKTEKEDIAVGLDAGADDFLSKPTDSNEMKARLRAGERLLAMQDDLVDKNDRITEAFDRLNTLYESIDRDLRAAARLQQALIPERQGECGPVPIGVAYCPAGHVGGDLLGYFRVSHDRVVAYSIDVSGHGVSSALLTMRLSNFFNSQQLGENIGVTMCGDGIFRPRDPAAVMTDLNHRVQDDADNDQYFTMLYADVNLTTGLVRYCQAAHPNPAIIRATGEIEFIGDGGPPVGLMPDMNYETQVVHLAPGDRFMTFSDGIVECESPHGQLLENEGLADILNRHWGMSEREVLDQVMLEMKAYTQTDGFDDDVSALLFTMPS